MAERYNGATFKWFRDTERREGRARFRADLKARMREVREDAIHPFNDKNHPDHDHVVEIVRNAYRWLFDEVGEHEE